MTDTHEAGFYACTVEQAALCTANLWHDARTWGVRATLSGATLARVLA